MDPERFLDTADLLGGDSAMTESDARTAVGRAYYAVAITIRERVCSVAQMKLQETETHAFVNKWLERSSKEKHIGPSFTAFKILRRARGLADYDMSAAPEHWSAPSVAARLDDARLALEKFRAGFHLMPAPVVKATAKSALDDVTRPRTR